MWCCAGHKATEQVQGMAKEKHSDKINGEFLVRMLCDCCCFLVSSIFHQAISSPLDWMRIRLMHCTPHIVIHKILWARWKRKLKAFTAVRYYTHTHTLILIDIDVGVFVETHVVLFDERMHSLIFCPCFCNALCTVLFIQFVSLAIS